jgi:hypothetical protein
MRTALVTGLAVASAAALASGVATAAQARGHQPAAQAGARAAARVQPASSKEKFRIINVSAGSRHQSVLATGSFTAGGYQVPGAASGGRAVDKMVFPSGSFKVTRRIYRQSHPLPTRSCLLRITISGAFSLGSGTGAFRGISGSGGFTTRISEVLRRSHGTCGSKVTVFQQIGYETGKVHR